MTPPPSWMLIDGSSIIFRAFYGNKSDSRTTDGRPANAVRGFVESLIRLLYARHPVRIAIAADADWRPQRRVDLVSTYKAHRTDEPVPPALIPQLPIIERLLAAVGIAFVGVPGLEAEDVIASWAEQVAGRIEIVSGDRDLFALIRDPDIMVLYPEKAGLTQIDEAEITRRYDIPGRHYGDFAVLRGDPSDGLPGLPGVGSKSAASMVRKYGSVEAVIDSGTLSAESCEYLRRALAVSRPGSDRPVPVPNGCRPVWPADPAAVDMLASELGMLDPINRLLGALSAMPADSGSSD